MIQNSHYKLIIIGAGIAGLSTALAWKKVYPKENVLLIEKNNIPGGCVGTFSRQGYKFDTTQIIPDITNLLEFYDVEVPLVKFENYYARLFMADTKSITSKIVEIPSLFEDFEKMMIEKYPEDKKGIMAFFLYCQQMHDELNYLKTEPKWYQIPKILFKCTKIIINSNKTYHQFLKKFKFKNPEVFQVFDTFSSFSGLSGDKCAALLTACAMVTTLKGSYRPKKGFIQFPVALKKKFLEKGGEIRTNIAVEKILIENGKTKGVQFFNGEKIYADFVVSTADTKVNFEKLIGEETLIKANKNYYNKLRSVKMSPSGFSINIGLDDDIDLNALGFNCGYNVLTSSINAHAKMFDAWQKGKLIVSDEDFHLAVICPSLMTGGKQTLIIHVIPVPSEKWINLYETDYNQYLFEKKKMCDFYIKKVEQYMIPNLSKHIVIIDISTPASFKRRIGSPSGSQYDMLPVPSNFGKNRISSRTPIKGLFIPKFSHGIWPSMQAGLQVIDMISGGKIMHGNSSLK
jgi:all-trans-retinol 13,14-reductase